MSNQFIEKLESLLNQYDISNQEKDDILSDYKQMIEDGKQKGMSEAAVIEMVGKPEKIVNELGYSKKKLFPSGEKLIALSPFISFIAFIILGLTQGLWHPGWIVFVLVPITAIIVEMGNNRDPHLLTALSPFIASIAYLILGHYYGLWHPGWLVFLIIPVTAIIIEMGRNKDPHLLTALSPFVSFTIYLLLGHYYGLWHPAWIVFIIIPMFGIINSRDEMDRLTYFTALSPFISFIAFLAIGTLYGVYHLAWLVFLLIPLLGIFHLNNIKHRILLLVSLVISTLLYLLIGMNLGDWIIAAFSFSLFVIAGLYTDFIQIEFDGATSKLDLFVIILSLILFIGIGYFLELWTISWLCLFIIPVYMIIKYRTDRYILTPISPFVAISILVLLGYFMELWHLSWIALILIPIVAIIEHA